MTALPDHTTPDELAREMGLSPRRVRAMARDLGACRIFGNRMVLLREDVIEILASLGAETNLLTTNLFPPLPPPTPQPRPSIHVPKQGYIYVIDCDGFIKIGYSTDPRGRLSNLRVASPLEITVLRVIEGTVADERELHNKFVAHRVRGEWFKCEGELAAWIEAGCPK